MPTDKISKFDVDNSIFTKNNPPTPNDVSAVAWLGSLSLEQVTDATYPINYEGSIGTEIASSIGLDSTFYYIKYFAYTVASGYGTMIAIPLQYNHVIPKFRTSDGALWTNWTTGYLPLTGGELSDILWITLQDMYSRSFTIQHAPNNSKVAFAAHTWGGQNVGWLRLYAGDIGETDYFALDMNNNPNEREIRIGGKYNSDVEQWYRLFGEHNKPTGSYTGNGSSSYRSILVGGIGDAVLVWGDNYTSCIVTPTCTYGFNGNELNYVKGVMIVNGDMGIASNESFINANGVTYKWRVL